MERQRVDNNGGYLLVRKLSKAWISISNYKCYDRNLPIEILAALNMALQLCVFLTLTKRHLNSKNLRLEASFPNKFVSNLNLINQALHQHLRNL